MIGFVGLSHLGIVSSIAAAAKEWTVRAVDPDAALCEGLQLGRLPLFEPNLAEMFAAARDRIQFTSEFEALNECNLIYFSQDVPTDESNHSRLDELPKRILQAAELAAP